MCAGLALERHNICVDFAESSATSGRSATVSHERARMRTIDPKAPVANGGLLRTIWHVLSLCWQCVPPVHAVNGPGSACTASETWHAAP